ncbi:unnamed protein product, partial [Brassica oleracea]
EVKANKGEKDNKSFDKGIKKTDLMDDNDLFEIEVGDMGLRL